MNMPQQTHLTSVAHAVILAAGKGIPFKAATHACPKPLLKVYGIPLIRRTIQTAQKAGIRYFTVITGYRAELLEAFLYQKDFPGVEIQCIRNDEWQRGNGLSARKALGAVQEPFLLLMADHLFDTEIIKKVSAAPLHVGHCRLAVDFHPEKILDPEDATKVHVVDGYISAIGKDIKKYNAIDTGIFLCSHALFDALETAISRGEESLSAGIRDIALKQRMEAVDIGDLFWRDVDNEGDLKEGERALLQTLVSATDSWLTRHINRRISLAVTRHLARTRIKPNHITLFNFCLGLMGAAFMLWGTYSGFLLASVLFIVSSILDGCDGEIARIKFQESRLGAWLDVSTDNISHLALFTCMTIGLILYRGSAIYILPGGLLLIGSLFSFYMVIVAHKRLKGNQDLIFSKSRLQDISGYDRQKHLALWLDRFANRDFAYLLLFLSFINRPGWFLWIAGIGAPIFGFLFYRTLTDSGTTHTYKENAPGWGELGALHRGSKKNPGL
jgi:CDP-L-myo-inositol myo-inositolphosphotransferase